MARQSGIHLSLLAFVVCGCDSGPAGPSGQHWLAPTFDVQPGLSSDITCAHKVAWDFSTHFASGTATFYPPGSGEPRAQCGELAFDESPGDPGQLVLRWHLNDVNQWQRWARDLRDAQSGSVVSDTTLGDAYYATAPDTTATFGAPANNQYDIVAFAHHRANTHDSLTLGEVNAKAQLWRSMLAPTNLTTTSLGSGRVQVSWSNHHRNRLIDSTEIYRYDGAVWQLVKSVDRSAATYQDSVPNAGTWSYVVRHVTALIPYPDQEDVGDLARPNSPATAAANVSVPGPVPPFITCEGNFAPTMDCHWFDTSGTSNLATQVWRSAGGPLELRATLGTGVHDWTDPSVLLHVTYYYYTRHVQNDFLGNWGGPDTALAYAVAPDAFICGGGDATSIICSWVNHEPNDTTVVERHAFHTEWIPIKVLAPGVNGFTDTGLITDAYYWYRVFSRRGSDSTGYSNEFQIQAGHGGAYRPAP